jgi:polar amino acid transport system substrate-binding protein
MILIMALAMCSAGVHAIDLHITTGFTPPVSDFFRQVLAEADRRLPDVAINFEVLPAERSLELVEKGINDADCCRIPAVIFKSYKHFIAVNESFYSVRFSAFAREPDLAIRSFADLKPYAVGTVKGWKAAVNQVHAIGPAREYVVTSPEQLFQMLDKDRIDVGVMGYASGLKAISDLQLKGIYVVEPPLLKKDLFLMLSDRHAALVPVFEKVFKEMRQDGTIERLYQDMLRMDY